MKLDLREVVQGILVGLALAVLATAIQTYVEVKQLRHDVDRLEETIVNVIMETVK